MKDCSATRKGFWFVNRDDYGSMDRISELPQPMLHQILCFLSQKEAIQTSVLSKSWRYLGSTRPKIDFHGSCFLQKKELFISVLDKTFQRYHDQKLSIQEFVLETLDVDSLLFPLLEKWIQILITPNLDIKTFKLCFRPENSPYFDLPSIIFQLKSLEALYIDSCSLNQINSIDKQLISLKNLKKLSLARVHIADETFEKIMSSCPLIEFLSLHRIKGLRKIRIVNQNHNLKRYDSGVYEMDHSIEIDLPTNWHPYRNYFPRLKSLYLNRVLLSTKSFDRLSSTFPCLEELELASCYGFKELHLSTRSLKRFAISTELDKADIDAPNLVKFEYRGRVIPSISFTSIQKEWKSDITVYFRGDDYPSWFHELNELLEAVCGSEISLHVWQLETRNNQHIDDQYSPDRAVVEHLELILYSLECDYSSFLALVDDLFCICRPRKIGCQYTRNANKGCDRAEKQNQVTRSLCKILQMERSEDQKLRWWQKDLEEVSLDVFEDDFQWHPVQGTFSWVEYCAELLPKKRDYPQKLRFLLKWRD